MATELGRVLEAKIAVIEIRSRLENLLLSQKQLDENKLLELLELAKIADQKMRESNEGLTALAEKWQSRAKVMLEKVQKQG